MDADMPGGQSSLRSGVVTVPRPRVFPLKGTAPGPRCGHTLTTITGPDGDVAKARLVLFGAWIKHSRHHRLLHKRLCSAHVFWPLTQEAPRPWRAPHPRMQMAQRPPRQDQQHQVQQECRVQADAAGSVCISAWCVLPSDAVSLAIQASLNHPALSSSGIRLAGATNDVHLFDIRTGTWLKITPLGEPPSPRAAHASAAVGNMVVVQVGSQSEPAGQDQQACT